MNFFYNNSPISHMLIGWFVSSIRQAYKIWKLGLAHIALCKWATCTRDLPFKNFIYSRYLTSFRSCYCKKQIDISFYGSALLLKINFVNIVKVCCRTTLTMLWCNFSSIRRQIGRQLGGIYKASPRLDLHFPVSSQVQSQLGWGTQLWKGKNLGTI